MTTQLATGVGPYGDVAWDPITKRTYMVTAATGVIGYMFMDDIQIVTTDTTQNPTTYIYGAYLNQLVLSTGATPDQLAFTNDGTNLYGLSTSGTNTYLVNIVPPVPTFTVLTPKVTTLDAATWPATLSVPF
jgi:hypothetical protein